jgi:iron(III) transport system substrate-binding protein
VGLLASLAGPASAQKPDWQAEWDRTVAAAKQEGAVVVSLSPNISRRDFIVKQWQHDYPDIKISATVVAASFVPAIATEYAAGKHLWDVLLNGPNLGSQAIKAGLLDPLRPEFILPENTDESIWGGWKDSFYDTDRTYMLGLVSDLQTFYYDANVISPDKANQLGLKLLLEPEVKGKIVWYDPRAEGPGVAFLVLINNVLGHDALKRIITEQEPVFVHAMNEAASALARGKAVIAFGGNAKENARQYKDAGLPIDWRMLGNAPDKAYRGTGGSAIAVFKDRPHPNAARVFVNWLMSRTISEGLDQAQGYDSRRNDVPPLDPNFAAIPGVQYIYAQRGENDQLTRQLMAEVKQWRPQ